MVAELIKIVILQKKRSKMEKLSDDIESSKDDDDDETVSSVIPSRIRLPQNNCQEEVAIQKGEYNNEGTYNLNATQRRLCILLVLVTI